MRLAVSTLFTLLLASTAQAHYDFTPAIVGNKIVTGGVAEDGSESVANLRVNGLDFGEEATDPYNIGDPGFNTAGASAFAAGSTLRLRALTYNGSPLSYWNGVGEPSFGSAPAGVTLAVTASPTRSITYSSTSLTYAPAADTSLLVGTFVANGSLHQHLGSSIFFSGDQVDGSVPTGVYLVSFELLNPGTGVAGSDSLFILYNNGLSEEGHDAAIDFVASGLTAVPEPTFAVALFPMLALMKRRR